MHQRDLYVVQVKQYCDSVDTFPTIYFYPLRKSGVVTHRTEVGLDAFLVSFSLFLGFKCMDHSEDSAVYLNSSYSTTVCRV